MDKETKEAFDFALGYNHISMLDMDNILEELQDMDCLSERGRKFRFNFWKVFIKREEKI